MIEVATFRAPPKDDTHTTDEGMITRDNVWGTIEEDFARRDFSINALYYQPIKGEILDFCGAIDDINSKTLRLLGDAKVRVEEDPVRLLRALRFKAKLGFEFDKALAKQFNEDNWALLEQVSAHRLYDETQKMFSGGYLSKLLPLLFKYGAMPSLMAYPPKHISTLVEKIAQNTDMRVAADQGANPAFFYATLLWENYLYHLAKFKKKGLPFHDAQQKASAKVIEVQRQKTAIPHFAEEFISDIWLLQPRLANPKARDIDELIRHPKFRPAFDFLVMREAYDDLPMSESTNGMGAWWQRYQSVGTKEQMAMVEALEGGVVQEVKGKRSRRRQHATADTAELLQLQQLSLAQTEVKQSPKPLFHLGGADEVSKTKQPPVPRPRQIAVPVFEKVTYTEADFLKLLNNDEPYIPSVRYRKRQPSSTLSLVERRQGMTESAAIAKSDTPQAAQVDAQAPTTKPKRRRTRKPNAKPKTDE